MPDCKSCTHAVVIHATDNGKAEILIHCRKQGILVHFPCEFYEVKK